MSIHVYTDADSSVVQMVTTTRDDLVAISRILAQAIAPEFLFNKDHALTVVINGMYESGKSIVPLEMRNVLFKEAEEQQMKGRDGFDEFHQAKINGRLLQLHSIDPLWMAGYGHPLVADAEGNRIAIENSFKNIRREAGIDFIINSNRHHDPDLSIWIENNERLSNNNESARRDYSPLFERFTSSHQNHVLSGKGQDWTRYIEVKILSSAFGKAAADLRHLAICDSDINVSAASAPRMQR